MENPSSCSDSCSLKGDADMDRTGLKERIKQGLLLLDGAMGTELIARGARAATCADYLNVTSPDIVRDVHRSYFEAGSDAVITNTFGANSCALKRHGLADKAAQLNTAGAEIARQAAGDHKYVLGDIGPSGEFLTPLGNLKPEDLKAAFAEQAAGLAAGRVDGFIIETMAALDELTAAVEAVKSVRDDLPLLASMAFESGRDDFRTMMGVSVPQAVSHIAALGVDALGFNCGSASLDEYVRLAEKIAAAVNDSDLDMLILAEPNAGKPELLDGQPVYRVAPADFADAAEKIRALGFNIVGGCCGTGPEHIRALVKKLASAG